MNTSTHARRLAFVGAVGPKLQYLRDRIEAARLREAQR